MILIEKIKDSVPFRDQDLIFQEVVKALFDARDGIIDDPYRALTKLVKQIGNEKCPYPDVED